MPAGAGIRFGQYVLVRRIARGGMAEVFLAQQRGLEGFDRRVAVKRILPHLADAPDFVKMFLGEAKLAAQLSHPNIVHIYEFGKVEHDYFIAMEYVEGVHAGQLFRPEGQDKLPVTLVARIGADAAAALHYAHELRAPNGKSYGLVHRDVSPANIMLSFDGVVKLCDFGIAKAAAVGDQLTNPGQVKGKYAYMSPEQTTGGQLDGRSDVFALAIVMWELLTGRYIVPRGDAVTAMKMIRDGALEPLSKAAPHVPAELAQALQWALETRREKRATAADLAQALEAFIKKSPELATPMQLAAWVRSRFPRTEDSAGLDDSTVRPSHAAASPRTMAGSESLPAVPAHTAPPPAPAKLPLTPYPQRRIVKLLNSDMTEGTEIYTTAPAEDEEGATIKTPRFTGGPPPPADHDATVRARPFSGDDDATEIAAPRHRPSLDEEDSSASHETVLRDFRAPVPSGPAAVPTRMATSVPHLPAPALPEPPGGIVRRTPQSMPVASDVPRTPPNMPVAPHGIPRAPTNPPYPAGVPRTPGHMPVAPRTPLPLPSHLAYQAPPPAQAPPRGTSENAALPRQTGPGFPPPGYPPGPPPGSDVARGRRQRFILGGALAGIALLSFVIALAASGGDDAPAVTRDAGTLVMHESSSDASIEVTPIDDAAFVPTVPIDAGASAQLALVVVRTIPDGGTIRVGTQVYAASVQPGDPSGARTAQLSLAAGRYTLEADLAGYAPETREIQLEGGQNQTIEIMFTKRLGAATERVATGKLSVRTVPWSDVYLAGKKLGKAPFASLDLPAGTHTLTFKNPSRPPVTKTVTIKAGKLTKLSFSL